MKSYHCPNNKAKFACKYNDNYAYIYVVSEKPAITAEHHASMATGKYNRKANRYPHSVAKKRTFVSNYRSLDLEETSGTPYFFTLKPLCEVEPKTFREAMTRLTRFLRASKAEYIYTLEWAAHEQTPHVHLVSNIPGETIAELEAFAERVIDYWLRVMPKVIKSRIKQDARAVYDSGELFSYMSKQSPNEFNVRAVETGKDWSVISVTSSSRNWKTSSFEGDGVSREAYMAFRRPVRALLRSRGVNLRKKAKGCDSETKRAISEVSTLYISGLPRKEVRKLFAQVNASQPLKERRFLIEMMERYRRAHNQYSQEEKDKVDQLLLAKGYDMRDMYPQWEMPKMSMAERYKTVPVYRLLRKTKKAMMVAREK